MSIVIAHHRVKDYKSWKPYYDRDTERRKSLGSEDIAVGQNAEDPQEVYMIWKVQDPSNLKDMGNDEELKRLMQEAGVISELSYTVVND